jgi:hypothetical protein
MTSFFSVPWSGQCRMREPLIFPLPAIRYQRLIEGTLKSLLPYHSLMTVILCIAAAILAVFLVIPPVSAHPPSDMSVTYHEISKDLQVSIMHAVPDPREHYIKEVTVTINGKVVNYSRYISQPAPDTFTYTYPISTVTGDEIKVTALCSLAGSISRTLYNTGPIASAPSSSPESQPTQKASAGLLPLLGVAAVLLIGKK